MASAELQRGPEGRSYSLGLSFPSPKTMGCYNLPTYFPSPFHFPTFFFFGYFVGCSVPKLDTERKTPKKAGGEACSLLRARRGEPKAVPRLN